MTRAVLSAEHHSSIVAIRAPRPFASALVGAAGLSF
jgi:hypothetical protein